MPENDRFSIPREGADNASSPSRASSRRPVIMRKLCFWVTAGSVLVIAINIIQTGWTYWVSRRPVITFGTMGTSHDVQKYGAGESGFNVSGSRRNPLFVPGALVAPLAWDSSVCMEHWDRLELLTEVDPNGYVVFVNGREQLGKNKYLVVDGIFIAKMLDRTLVEFPAKDARISAANSTLGLGAYWDLSEMCMSHRILDIHSFRRLVETGRLTPEDFVTIEIGKQPHTTTHFRNKRSVERYYGDKLQYKVIVMEQTWRSSIKRHPFIYLSPNPFYLGVTRMLMIEHEVNVKTFGAERALFVDFQNGEFIAVQWRTETATGNMSACYDEIRTAIEDHRIRLGYSQDQVLFSTDMYGRTSGTYRPSKKNKIGGEAIRRIRDDYPKALDNRLHDFFNAIEDSGIKAIVSGLVMAQSAILLASSLNGPESATNPEACVCQKHSSGYVRLIAEWRTRIFRKDPETLVRLFPFGEIQDEDTTFQTTIDGNPVRRNILAVGLKAKNHDGIKRHQNREEEAKTGEGGREGLGGRLLLAHEPTMITSKF